MGEDEPEDEAVFRNLWEDEVERETMLISLCRLSAGTAGKTRGFTSLWDYGGTAKEYYIS